MEGVTQRVVSLNIRLVIILQIIYNQQNLKLLLLLHLTVMFGLMENNIDIKIPIQNLFLLAPVKFLMGL